METNNLEIVKEKNYILVVDDDEQQLSIYEMLLQRGDSTIITSTSAIDALEILQTINVDVLICDVMMPLMDGRELVKKVRDEPKNEDLTILSFSVNDYEDEMLALGANAFFTKSHTRKLLSHVENLVAQ